MVKCDYWNIDKVEVNFQSLLNLFWTCSGDAIIRVKIKQYNIHTYVEKIISSICYMTPPVQFKPPWGLHWNRTLTNLDLHNNWKEMSFSSFLHWLHSICSLYCITTYVGMYVIIYLHLLLRVINDICNKEYSAT